MNLYLRTPDDPHELLQNGLQDNESADVKGVPMSGILLYNTPPNIQDALDAHNVVGFDIPEDVVEDFEIFGQEFEFDTPVGFDRTFLVPAAILNRYPGTIMEVKRLR